MRIYHLILIAFLVSLFIGSKAVSIGLGIVLTIVTLGNIALIYGWLD